MQPQAIIFDRDGVLTYFDIDYAVAFLRPLLPFALDELAQRWEAWGKQVGFPADLAQEQAFWAGFWQHLNATCDLTPAQYQTLAGCNYTDFMRCFPEVPGVLAALKQRGIPVGVLSNFSLASLDASLEAVGIRGWIDVACAATVIGHAKPHPDAYRHVAELLHTPPEACLFFDDEPPCVAGAQALGMTAYLVDRQADAARAPHTVHSLQSALELFV